MQSNKSIGESRTFREKAFSDKIRKNIGALKKQVP